MTQRKHEYASIAELLEPRVPKRPTGSDVVKALACIAVFVFTAFCIAASMNPVQDEHANPLMERAIMTHSTKSKTVAFDANTHAERTEALGELVELGSRLHGNLYFPFMKSFTTKAAVWNEAAEAPIAVVEAADAFDVVQTMELMNRLPRTELVIRSGGHHLLGYSSAAGAVVLSVADLDSVEVDENGLMTMGPGARVQDVLYGTLPQGWASVVGVCGLVAEGGHTLGGGIGFYTRKYGLAADNVKSYELVLHDGTVVTASDEEHEELFWALRGAGSNNFGVVTQIQLQAYPAAEDQVMAEVTLAAEDAARFFSDFGKLEGELPLEIFAFFDCIGAGEFTGTVTYIGEDEEDVAKGTDFLESEFPKLLQINPETVEVSPFNWIDFTFEDDNLYGNLANSWSGFISQDSSTAETFQTILDEVNDLMASPYMLIEFDILGGAINDRDADFNAFPFRDTLWMFCMLELVPADLEDAQTIFEDLRSQADSVYEKLKPLFSGSYLNYPTSALSKEEYPSMYYGQHLERLQAIKRQYDPDNRIRNKQSIPMQGSRRKKMVRY